MPATRPRKRADRGPRVKRPIRVIVRPNTKAVRFLSMLVSHTTNKINEASMNRLIAYMLAELAGTPSAYENFEPKAAQLWANIAFVIRQGLIAGYSFNIPSTGVLMPSIQQPRRRFDPNRQDVVKVGERRCVRFRTARPFWLEINDGNK